MAINIDLIEIGIFLAILAISYFFFVKKNNNEALKFAITGTILFWILPEDFADGVISLSGGSYIFQLILVYFLISLIIRITMKLAIWLNLIKIKMNIKQSFQIAAALFAALFIISLFMGDTSIEKIGGLIN